MNIVDSRNGRIDITASNRVTRDNSKKAAKKRQIQAALKRANGTSR